MSPENKHHSSDDEALKLYDNVSTEVPPRSLDKLIMAAAEREVSKPVRPVVKRDWKQTFWELMRFPASMAGALFVTVALAHIMWPLVNGDYVTQAHPVIESTKAQGTVILLENNESPLSYKVDKNRQLQSNKDAQPKKNSSMKVITDDALALADSLLDLESLSATEENTKNIKIWVAEIIELAKNKRFEEMQNEIDRFKTQYPHFPIAEQIRPFLR